MESGGPRLVETLAHNSAKCVVVGYPAFPAFDACFLQMCVFGVFFVLLLFHLRRSARRAGDSKEARGGGQAIPHLLERLCALDAEQQESQPHHPGPRRGQVGGGGDIEVSPRLRQHTTGGWGTPGQTWARRGSDPRTAQLEGSLGIL